ncbi:PAS domain S-box protein [Tepidiforma thermophila]|uniref:PAS domain S-box-containing protein n=1 Tax=Tepidiforma thermophila (strain KCTC 52669 / CGMCC 1.13589 / G233) TaxID=2761530 RepID=A0A2A9HIK0_TEPT2|nr:PAS domain S-box protein [Tepidiforma thermophila]PFG75011.1 PAS domain S-box-containing protein [Tepidiforma thermophila]
MPSSLADLLLRQSPDAVIFAGLDGVIQVWNPAAEAMFGFPAAEAIGQDLNIIIPEPFREAHWTAYDRALAAGDTKYRGQAMPTRARRADGSEFYIEMTFAIVKDETGTVLGALAHCRDITERFERDRSQRRRLRELEAELERLQGPAATP